MSYDVAIIGSGLGGLIAGAKLAKEGRKILIVEQHSSIGGYATCFTQDNFTIDVGFHSMDGLYAQDPKIKVFEDLDVYFNIEFVDIPTGCYRFTNNRTDFTLPDRVEDAINVLIEKFPKEEKGIRLYFETIDEIFSSEWKDKTAGEMLDSMFENNNLKLALAGPIQYYGDDPYTLSALSFAAAMSRNLKGGKHYIKGGSIKLTHYLADYIREHGSIVLLNEEVTKIIVNQEKETVEGIEYKSTSDESSETTFIEAKHVVVNAPLPVATKLLSSERENVQRLRETINSLKIGHSVLNIYFGFNTTLDKLGHNNYFTVVNDESVFSLSDIFGNNNGGYSRKNYIFVDYGQTDTGMAPFGKSTGIISTVDYIDNWNHLNKEDYNNKKKEIETIFTERLNKLIPDVVDHIEHISVATPKTMERYTHNTKGSVIGFARNPKQVGMYPLTSPFKNLYFASAWSIPGGGFTSIIDAGWQVATSILKKRR
ncbi:MAG: phytoene desaturase family protein [Candidatus Heimdallarchaeaceae archaeon]